jgi:hypothetical protein
LKIAIFNVDNGNLPYGEDDSFSILDMKVEKLPQYDVWWNKETQNFYNFAVEFSQNAGILSAGDTKPHIYRSDDGTQNITRVYHPNDKKLIDLARNTENILFTRINELYGNAENTPSEIGELYADMQNIVKAQEYEAAAKKREEIIKIQTELSERNLTQNNFNTFLVSILHEFHPVLTCRNTIRIG